MRELPKLKERMQRQAEARIKRAKNAVIRRAARTAEQKMEDSRKNHEYYINVAKPRRYQQFVNSFTA